MSTKINIILCDTFPGLLPPSIPSYVSMFTTLFDSVCNNAEYHVYEAMNGHLPTTLGQHELYVITGCNLSAYDDIAWIRQLSSWIKEADKARIKLAGICFGHQIIAHALGGRVERAANGWGVGIREAVVTDKMAQQMLGKGVMRMLYNHHDQVVKLPEKATLIASSDFCPIESFRIDNNIITFQGHPEYVVDYERHLINNFADDEPEDLKSAAIRSMTQNDHHGKEIAAMLVEWIDM
ncbi:MAG: hypothetical protein ACI4V5_08885 [Prevotella sp.]